jgi:hypothetical protein
MANRCLAGKSFCNRSFCPSAFSAASASPRDQFMDADLVKMVPVGPKFGRTKRAVGTALDAFAVLT